MTQLKNFVRDESGATAIEYGIIAAVISIVALAAMQVVGTQISRNFSYVASALQTARS